MAARQPDPGHERPAAAAKPAGPASPPDRETQARILSESIDGLEGRPEILAWESALAADDRARLAAVISGRGGSPALDTELVTDLVAAVLPDSLAALVEGPQARRRLFRRVARALLDDPISARRLQSLVTALTREAEPRLPEEIGGSS